MDVCGGFRCRDWVAGWQSPWLSADPLLFPGHSMTFLFNKQIQEPIVEKTRILEGGGALLFVCSSASPGKSSYGQVGISANGFL